MRNTTDRSLSGALLASLGLLALACGKDDGSPSAPEGDPAPTSVASAGSTADPASSSDAPTATAGTDALGAGAPSTGTPSDPATPPTTPSGTDTVGSGEPPTSEPGTSEWRMMGYDLGSTFFNRAETTLTKENAATLEVAWTADMGTNVYGAPLQVGDTIYASGSSVRAFDAATGSELWSAQVSTSGSMSYADGTLYLHDRTANIVAIDAADGSELWSRPANPDSRGDGTSSPLVVGDLVVVGGSNGTIELIGGTFRGFLAALDRATGDVAWVEYTVPTGVRGASIWSSPAADLAAGRVYGTTGNNYGSPASDTSDAFIAFDLGTGVIEWKNQRVENDTFGGGIGQRNGPDADFGANPVLYETTLDGTPTKLLAAGNKGGVAHAVRAEDGMHVWTRELCPGSTNGSRGIFTNSAWTGTNVLVACNEATTATLYALDGASGDIAWMRTLPGLVWGRTAVANGVGAVGAGEALEVFDADTGALIKSFPSNGGTVAGTITIANGRIAFGEGLTWASGVAGSTLTVLALP